MSGWNLFPWFVVMAAVVTAPVIAIGIVIGWAIFS